jgi:hypothetical protein
MPALTRSANSFAFLPWSDTPESGPERDAHAVRDRLGDVLVVYDHGLFGLGERRRAAGAGSRLGQRGVRAPPWSARATRSTALNRALVSVLE